MEGLKGHFSKYFVLSIIVIFLICMTIYLTFTSSTVILPTMTEIRIEVQEEAPLRSDDIYIDETEARRLFKKVTVYCWILTTKSGIVSKASAVNFTWAQRCNKHIFFASAYGEETPAAMAEPPIPGAPPPPKVTFDLSAGQRQEYKTKSGETFATITIGDVIFIDTPEGYSNLTEKSREILQFLYLTEIDKYGWFLKADDDTYFILENLRYFLQGLDMDQPAYLGYQLEPTWFDSPYMSGGAGYVFNRAGLKLLVERGLQTKGMCQEKGSFEDLEVGRCAVKSGVTIYSSLDKFERETFHPDNINDYIPGPPPEWLHYYSRNKPKGGSECCSQFSISFHRMTARDMLVFDHLLYKTNVYGIKTIGNMPNFFRYNKMKKLPNGLAAMNQLPPQFGPGT